MKKKITFLLEEDEDGYPPVAAEGIWAEHLGGDRYELDNIPFFAREATLGDVVRVRIVEGETRYLETVTPSENSLLRVVCFEGVDLAMLRRRIEATGCSTEHDAAHALIAISVPAAVELSDVYASFEPEYSNEMLDYEEPILRHQAHKCVESDWRPATTAADGKAARFDASSAREHRDEVD